MSDYTELLQYVRSLSDDAQKNAYILKNQADNVEHHVAIFDKLTESTRDSAAMVVGTAFRTAQKQLLVASRALLEVANAGYTWGSDSQPELKLVLFRRR